MKPLHDNTLKQQYFLEQRVGMGLDVTEADDRFEVVETFGNKYAFLAYLHKNYNAENKTFWFDRNIDRTGNEVMTRKSYRFRPDGEEGSLFQPVEQVYRKRFIFAKEGNDPGWLDVVNPYDFMPDVWKRVEKYGNRISGTEFRNGPVSRRGRRFAKNRSGKTESAIQHTGAIRREMSRYQDDKEWVPRLRNPNIKYDFLFDWDYCHVREGKSWKSKKIRKQWMKHHK